MSTRNRELLTLLLAGLVASTAFVRPSCGRPVFPPQVSVAMLVALSSCDETCTRPAGISRKGVPSLRSVEA